MKAASELNVLWHDIQLYVLWSPLLVLLCCYKKEMSCQEIEVLGWIIWSNMLICLWSMQFLTSKVLIHCILWSLRWLNHWHFICSKAYQTCFSHFSNLLNWPFQKHDACYLCQIRGMLKVDHENLQLFMDFVKALNLVFDHSAISLSELQ